MQNFTYNIKIQAAEREEAAKKINAAVVLIEKLTTKEIAALADTVANNPLKVSMAKKFLGL